MKKNANHAPLTTPHNATAEQPSLRTLAAELGVTHSAISLAFRAGRVPVGLSLDGRGRLIVTDARAVADHWRRNRVTPINLAHQEHTRAPSRTGEDDADADDAGVDCGIPVDLLDQALFAVIVEWIAGHPNDPAKAARDLAKRARPHLLDDAAAPVLEAAINAALEICLKCDAEDSDEEKTR